MNGISFLTPLDSLFALGAVVPLAALWLTHRRSQQVRGLLRLPKRSRRGLLPAAVALALLPALVGVAAAQPIVIRQRPIPQRADAQAFFVFDTSLSMAARSAPDAPTRLARAKREALRIAGSLGDIPVGIASMTDRTLPNLLPTTDFALFRRTLLQSVAIDRPPPSQRYNNRATTFAALLPLGDSHYFDTGVTHRIAVVFTDGESARLPSNFALTLRQERLVPPLIVHVWSAGEHIYVHGKLDRGYTPDPTSGEALARFAQLTNGRVFGEHDLGALAAAIRADAGPAAVKTTVTQYTRVPLAPWFVLAGVLPLAFLLWKRNW